MTATIGGVDREAVGGVDKLVFVLEKFHDFFGRFSLYRAGVEGGVDAKLFADGGNERCGGELSTFHEVEDGMCVIVHGVMIERVRIKVSKGWR